MDYGVPVTEYANKKIGVYGGKFYPFHNGHVSFIEEAAKYVDVLFVAVQYDEKHEEKLSTGTPFAHVPPVVRERWITETFKNNPKIRVLSHYEQRVPDPSQYPLLIPAYQQLEHTLGHIDIIFSNTHEYDNYFQTVIPQAEHIVFLENRDIIPISATQIREQGIYKNWEHLPQPVKNYYTQKVAFCGWESSGKTFTSQHIAQKYNTTYLPEYGRTYYENIGGYETINLPTDFPEIAIGHLHQLNTATGNKIIIVDTDLIYTQFYYLQAYNQLNPTLDTLIRENTENINHYIYLKPRQDFTDDGTRKRITYTERKEMSLHLEALYMYYGKILTIIDNHNDTDRITRAETKINNILQLEP